MYKKTILGNGIKVVTEEALYVDSVSIGVWAILGSRVEKKDEKGLAHFIEHMLFKGTNKRTATKIAKEIDSVGGLLNACTSKEYTTLYAKVLGKDLPLAIDILSDLFINPAFNPEEIEKERQVILQEIHMVEDTPDEYVQELFTRSFFGEHLLGYPVFGDKETIWAIDRAKMIDFFEECYTSDKLIISAVGNLKHNEVVSLVEKAFGGLKRRQRERIKGLPRLTPHISIYPKELEQAHLCLGTKGLSQTDSLRYTGYVLNAVLGGGMSSRLFQEVREKRGLVYSVYSYMSGYFDTGLFTVYAGTDGDASKEVIELIVRELERLKTNPLSRTELHAAKEQLKGNLLLACESVDNRMTRLAKSEIYFGRSVSTDEIINGIENVTPDHVVQLAGEIFNSDYLSLSVLGPVKESNITGDLLKI